MKRSSRSRGPLGLLVVAAAVLIQERAAPRARPIKKVFELRLDPSGEMGEKSVDPIPALDVRLREEQIPSIPVAPQVISTAPVAGAGGTIIHGAGGSPGLQAETTIASNEDGILIAGYNDSRGFSLDKTLGRSISGVSRSTDGGLTWTAGPSLFQTLPVLPSAPSADVFGDPDVKYDRVNRRWIYSSLYQVNGQSGLCIHTSSNDGMSWNGPLVVTPSLESGGVLADKEFIDINPVTGRIAATWARITVSSSSADYQIRVTFSDDGGQTWSAAQTISTIGTIVTGPIPRFYAPGGSTNATSKIFVAWRHITDNGTTASLVNTSFTRSMDGGGTWSAPVIELPSYVGDDDILGVDRTNTNPSMAIDPTNGRVYVVYQFNNSHGEGDIAIQWSDNPWTSFSSRMLINSNPGADRAQFFPSVAVDPSNRNVHVVYYDQDADTSGDLMEWMHTVSRDHGATWSRPTPLLAARAFHAGYGNDTSQPNTGDYIQNIARNGVHHAVAMATSIAPRFDEGGPPSPRAMVTPDVYYDRLPDPAPGSPDPAALRLGNVTFVETNCPSGANGNLDPGETANLQMPLRSYVSDSGPFTPTGAYTGVTATLSTATAGVTITNATSSYPDIASLATQTNNVPFQIALDSNFAAGTPIDFVLTVNTAQGSNARSYRLGTGTPGATTTLLNEDFESTPVGSLPDGWSTVHINGSNPTTVVPWTTSKALTSSNAAYHTEVGGPTSGNSMNWERLFSPMMVVPSAMTPSYVTVDFDIVYNLEDEPSLQILAYDGVTLQIFDASASPVRSVMAEAFAEIIRTGNIKHFPKHLISRNGRFPNYLDAVAAWSGNSQGTQHVFMKFPGAGMAGHQIQLRFEYTEDENTACQVPPCGVAIDNVVVKQVLSGNASCLLTTPGLSIGKGSVASTRRGAEVIYNVTVTNTGPVDANAVVVSDSPGAGFAFISNSGDCSTPYPCNLGTIPSGQSRNIVSRMRLSSDYTSPTVQNVATLTSSSSLDPSRSVTSATATTAVSDVNADMAVTLSAPSTATLGGTLTYTISVQNNGPTDASDVVVRNATPPGLTFVSNMGACTTPFPCSLGTVHATASDARMITSQYSIPMGYRSPNPIQDTVTVESSSPDPNPNNNSASASTTIPGLPLSSGDNKGGCGCDSLGGFPTAGLGLLVLAFAKRRRRVLPLRATDGSAVGHIADARSSE